METTQEQQTKKWAEMTDAEKAQTADLAVEQMSAVFAATPDIGIATKETMVNGLVDLHESKGRPEIAAALRKILESEQAR